ncbi:MAG TPA: glutamate-5-semialdehyde dehydrogenase [Anaerolineaceae bacterium]|nr:glutamate-5-semialdehyde dehydrogenase [Anaerolineaceae bacterium]
MLVEMGKKARSASRKLAQATTEQKNAALLKIADRLWSDRQEILEANQRDVLDGRQAGLTDPLLDRLSLDENRLNGIINDLRSVAGLTDPVGEIFDEISLPNGLQVHKQRVPIGVLGVIYEARPNVTVDVAGLALKSGNSVILRGGSETLPSNKVLVKVIRTVLDESGLPVDAVQLIDDPDRARVTELLKLYEFVDMIIPRGSAALHTFCRENSMIPVITGGIGICHLYIDESADLSSTLPVLRNAKVQRPTVCNALDTVLVHRSIAAIFIPRLVDYLANDGVTFRIHASAAPYVGDRNSDIVQPAGSQDFDTEWLSLVLGIKVVDSLDEAIEHIAEHSTGHSDGIITRNDENAGRFVSLVDSAAVYVNASTRFTDGGQLGLGSEVAVSTQRLHARGPMGLRELTIYKWVIKGDYTYRK